MDNMSNNSKEKNDRFGIIEMQTKAMRPNERSQIDSILLGVDVLDDVTHEPIGRPWYTLIRDMGTGCIWGHYIAFEPPSYKTIMHTLKHAIPKKNIKEKYPTVQNEWLAYGLPEELELDNGREYKSEELQGACSMLNIDLHHCASRRPSFKGPIERFFKTLNTNLLHELPGKTFSNILDKKVRDSDSEKHTLITFGKLIEIINIWICDIYSQSYSEDVKGVPAQLWEEGIKKYGEPALPSSTINWEIALMNKQRGSIQRSGVRFLNLFYQSEELYELRRKLDSKPRNQRFVNFKFDPTDMSKIFVYDEFENKYIKVLCAATEYSKDLNLFTHKLANKMARDRFNSVDVVARSKALEKISDIVKEEGKKLKMIQRKTKARVKEIGTDKELNSVPPAEKSKKLRNIKGD
jgi:putative transposase